MKSSNYINLWKEKDDVHSTTNWFYPYVAIIMLKTMLSVMIEDVIL
jgi:hypothetical protein